MREPAPTRRKGELPGAFIRRSLSYYYSDKQKRIGIQSYSELMTCVMEYEDEIKSLRKQLRSFDKIGLLAREIVRFTDKAKGAA